MGAGRPGTELTTTAEPGSRFGPNEMQRPESGGGGDFLCFQHLHSLRLAELLEHELNEDPSRGVGLTGGVLQGSMLCDVAAIFSFIIRYVLLT